MATLSLVLVFAFIAGISGQPNPQPSIIYYDVGTSINNIVGATVTPVVNSTAGSSGRKSCFDGTDIYYTAGDSVFKITDTDTDTLIYTAPAGRTLKSIACRCNLLAVSLCDDSDNTFVIIITTNPVEDVIDLTFGVEGRAAIEFSTEGDCYFIVCTILKTRIYNCNDLAGDPMHMTAITLERQPRCIACHQDDTTGEVYIFVTFDGQTNVQLLYWDGTNPITVSSITVSTDSGLAPQAARVYSVDVADDYVYFLIATDPDSDNTQYELSRYPIGPWLAGTQNERDGIEELETGNDGDLSGSVNGLSVCGSACQDLCVPAGCGCSTTAPFCGFCFDDAGGGTCQCENSAAPNCADPDTEGECRVAIPRIDACCLVKNPLALRRSGGDVCVVGVTTVAGTIDVDRAARTGRWLKLPIHTVKSNADTSPYYEGFSAAVPPKARGRRFGVYRAHFDPDGANLMEEKIPCIATENSEFVNTFYTYTISRDQSVNLEADVPDRFKQSLRWRRTTFDGNYDPNDPVPVPSCDGSKVCKVSGSGLSDSIYEVYRPGREKRTWHPLFYLFVRSCEDGLFGAGCAFTCPTCVNGVCDDVNGLCNCYPGFTGDTCEDVCEPGFIGKGCLYECSDVFPGSDCSNILICNPGKVGCKCYPGLQAPACIKPCDAGYWGSNCQSTCTDPCDPRTGMPM